MTGKTKRKRRQLTPEQENISRRTGRSKTFDIGGGRHVLRIGRAPLHFQDTQGNWCDIDLTPRAEGPFAVFDNCPYQLKIDLEKPAYFYQSRSGKAVSVELVEIDGKPVSDQEPVYVNGVYRWADMVPGLDYVISPRLQGVSTDFFLSGPQAPRRFKWRVMGDKDLIQPLVGTDANRARLELETFYTDGFIETVWTGRAQTQNLARKGKWNTDIVYPVRIDPTINEEILANAYDARSLYVNSSFASMSINGNILYAGRAHFTDYIRNQFGLIFPAIGIPNNATINEAILTINVLSVAGSPALKVFGNDVDDAEEWNPSTNRIAAIQKTTAFANFSPVSTGIKQIDVTNVVHELVSRGGWSPNNNMAFGVLDTNAHGGTGTYNFIGVEAFENSGTDHATLDIEFTEPFDFYELTVEPVVGSPALAQHHQINATGIALQPTAGAPEATEVYTLSATGIAAQPAIGAPEATEIYSVSPTGLVAQPTVGDPDISQVHNFAATGLVLQPTAGAPSVSQTHVFEPTGVAVLPAVEAPAISQTHDLTTTGIAAQPTAGMPEATEIYTVSVTGLAVQPTVGDPAISQVHALSASEIVLQPTAGAPSIGQTHIFDLSGILATPTTGDPRLLIPTPTDEPRIAYVEARSRSSTVPVRARLAYVTDQTRTIIA